MDDISIFYLQIDFTLVINSLSLVLLNDVFLWTDSCFMARKMF